MGRTEIYVTAYVTTRKQLEEYKQYQDKEDLELLKAVDASIEAYTEDIEKYLKELKAYNPDVLGFEKKEPLKEEKPDTLLTPFKSIYYGFKEILSFNLDTPKKEKQKEPELTKEEKKAEEKQAEEEAKTKAWLVYDIFKKQNGFITP